MQDAVFGFNEWTLTYASWVFYFLAMLAFIGMLVAQAAQVSRRRVLAREVEDFGGVQPAFAAAAAGAGAPMASIAAPTLTLGGGRQRLARPRVDSAADTAAAVPMAASARLFGR